MVLRDVHAVRANLGRFETIVFGETPEHPEYPRAALEIFREWLAPDGAIWIILPSNRPTPDRLFLLRPPREAADLVAASGFFVARTAALPMTGASRERATRRDLPIGYVIVGKKVA